MRGFLISMTIQIIFTYHIFFRRDQMYFLFYVIAFSLHALWCLNLIIVCAHIKWDAGPHTEVLTVYANDLAFLHSFHTTFLNSISIFFKLKFTRYFRKLFGNKKAKALSSIIMDSKFRDFTSWQVSILVTVFLKPNENKISYQGIKLTFLENRHLGPQWSVRTTIFSGKPQEVNLFEFYC